MKVVLKILTGETKVEYKLGLDESLVIGRNEKADCTISDTKVSGLHCRLILRHDRLEIIDLESKNGSYLNGIKIEESEFFIGDVLKIGNTTITIDDVKTDKNTVNILTFPGPFQDRLKHELRVDFTGIRIQNQHFMKNSTDLRAMAAAHEREVAIRKKARSNIRLSKDELKERNTTISTFATLIDLGLMFLAFVLPIIVIDMLINFQGTNIPGLKINSSSLKDNRDVVLICVEVFILTAVFLVNFRFKKFTLGEVLTGIKKMYQNQ